MVWCNALSFSKEAGVANQMTDGSALCLTLEIFK
jgi:hypothetical protein